ncbi:hypothetical protein D9619_011016 [Psilocybe cf. subviscida]|uniref:Uncharacterized protein n=1 Tax=Psilocybe cf. subviscida TaxID=2480587 RepID=A0A8H5EZM4_9AGAR|nr:hypothetical protein D9619_011016 [Psilocybe cf. subviscida]
MSAIATDAATTSRQASEMAPGPDVLVASRLRPYAWRTLRAGSVFDDTDSRCIEYELLHNLREPTPETDEDGDAGEVKAKATAEFDAVLAPSSTRLVDGPAKYEQHKPSHNMPLIEPIFPFRLDKEAEG